MSFSNPSRIKNDDIFRFYIDYCKLNSMTIHDILDSLQEATFTSVLDLRTGYWQAKIGKKILPKIAFITQKGLFEFNVIPYGSSNAPAIFQRLMETVLAGFKWQSNLVYIDDITIYSSIFEKTFIWYK